MKIWGMIANRILRKNGVACDRGEVGKHVTEGGAGFGTSDG